MKLASGVLNTVVVSKLFNYLFLFSASFLGRIGDRVLLRSERIVHLHSLKRMQLSFKFFFEILSTYEAQKIAVFFCVLFN